MCTCDRYFFKTAVPEAKIQGLRELMILKYVNISNHPATKAEAFVRNISTHSAPGCLGLPSKCSGELIKVQKTSFLAHFCQTGHFWVKHGNAFSFSQIFQTNSSSFLKHSETTKQNQKIAFGRGLNHLAHLSLGAIYGFKPNPLNCRQRKHSLTFQSSSAKTIKQL